MYIYQITKNIIERIKKKVNGIIAHNTSVVQKKVHADRYLNRKVIREQTFKKKVEL